MRPTGLLTRRRIALHAKDGRREQPFALPRPDSTIQGQHIPCWIRYNSPNAYASCITTDALSFCTTAVTQPVYASHPPFGFQKLPSNQGTKLRVRSPQPSLFQPEETAKHKHISSDNTQLDNLDQDHRPVPNEGNQTLTWCCP